MAFYSLANEPESLLTSHVNPDEPGFDIALSGKQYVIQLAFGPVPCDGENESSARKRWLGLFAKAAISRLRTDCPPIPLTDAYLDSLAVV
jgi:hypothetical protein